MTIETGYEGKFDFPGHAGASARRYLLASVPRSGSTYFSHLLWRTGCLGAPLEYLNFEPLGPYGHASSSPAAQISQWRADLARRTSPNGVFGLKGFPEQFDLLQRDNPALLGEVMRTILPSREAARVVWLRRRDRVAHGISYARAIMSGIWRKEQEAEGRAEPEYSAIALDRATRMIEAQEQAWTEMFTDLRLSPLELWYEDAVANPADAVAAVAHYLGVKLEPAAVVEIPVIERQSQDGAKAWAAQVRSRPA